MSKYGFDLDHALAAWRRSLEYNHAFTADDLDELEQHLRDQVAGLVADGLSEEAAFRHAMGEMGDYGAAEAEYRKVYWGKLRRQQHLLSEIKWRFSMFNNYLKVAWRNIMRHPGYAFINVFGLAVGLACCLLIGLYVQDELTFDRFHEHAEHIYKINLKAEYEGYSIIMDPPAALAPALLENDAAIKQSVRVHAPGRAVVSTGQEQVYEEGLLFTEPSFFEVFDFSMQQGNPAESLARPGTILITQEVARQYFGDENPVGQTLTLYVPKDGHSNEGQTLSFEVAGLVEPAPANSTLQFQMLASIATLEAEAKEEDNLRFETYLLLQDQVVLADIQARIDVISEDLGFTPMNEKAQLESFTSLHLNEYSRERETQFSGNQRYVYLFSVVALLVLLVGCVNFTNLATARSLRRAREVGVRKVVGAQRGQLIWQFLGEALLLTFFAMLVAVLLVELALPAFNALVSKHLDVTYFGQGTVLPWLGLFFLVVGLFAGSYPAFVLSRFQPTSILKGGGQTGRQGAWLRQTLVVFQFTISIALIVAVFVVHEQLQYIQTKNLGLQPDQVIALKPQEDIASSYDAFKQDMLELPGVAQVTFASLPGSIGMRATPEGVDEAQMYYTQVVDPDFTETLGIEVALGQDFSSLPHAEATQSVMINEAAAREFGWEDPVGKVITMQEPKNVVGVVADFHSYSLKQTIEPMIILTGAEPEYQSVFVRLQSDNLPATMDALQEVWAQFAPSHPFEYTFLDEQFAKYYRAERRLGQLFGVVSLLAVLIACLGLFGLAAFAAETRVKEIGIRKVLGASVPGLIGLLSRDFLKLVVIAFVLAAPLAYFAMQKWLEDFAYRIEMGPGVFVLAGVLAILIAVLTVSYQAIKAALANPVKSLRYE